MKGTYPISKVNKTATSGLQQDSAPERSSMKAKFPEWGVKLHFLLGDIFNFFTKTLKGWFQFVPKLSLSLERKKEIKQLYGSVKIKTNPLLFTKSKLLSYFM